MSLAEVYEIGFRQALQNIEKHGGRIDNDRVFIASLPILPVRLEQSFPGMVPQAKTDLQQNNVKEINFDFKGGGFVLRGEAKKKSDSLAEYVFDADLYIDDQKVESAKLPTSFTIRRHELFWKYALPDRQHKVRIEILNPDINYGVDTWDFIVYRDK